MFALLMLFLCVIVHTMWTGKSLQLLYILPFGMLCLSAISMMFVKMGVLVFSVMWSELLMTSVISCPLFISVRVPGSRVCVHISGED